ncbi:conserved hypothetical protein [Streptomyces filamentosus NRRL 15998]|uniref:Uncharacterized protein n=1 Tax=Streptomyces filamentosus NRRL 15998 TaxID=457431 RepID=D6AHX9_STRFL|nr:conserved hypothetical protein [Streptomyces filamentosus NRRL 15998]
MSGFPSSSVNRRPQPSFLACLRADGVKNHRVLQGESCADT